MPERRQLTVGSEAWKLDLYAEAARIIKRRPELSISRLRNPLGLTPTIDGTIPYPARSREYQRIWRKQRERRRSA